MSGAPESVPPLTSGPQVVLETQQMAQAATPGPPPRDHHDGQVTPGQAAYEAFYGSFGTPFEPYDSDVITTHWRAAWETGANAAAAAQQPEPGHSRALLEEALFLRQNGEHAPGGNENWRDWDDKAERFLRGLPATEPQPAPELAAAMAETRRYRHALARVREILDEGGTTHGSRLSRARSIIGAALEGK